MVTCDNCNTDLNRKAYCNAKCKMQDKRKSKPIEGAIHTKDKKLKIGYKIERGKLRSELPNAISGKLDMGFSVG